MTSNPTHHTRHTRHTHHGPVRAYVAVALAAHGVAPHVRVVMRAGEDDTVAETRSLPPMGVVCDITGLAAGYVVARLRAEPVGNVVARRDEIEPSRTRTI